MLTPIRLREQLKTLPGQQRPATATYLDADTDVARRPLTLTPDPCQYPPSADRVIADALHAPCE